MMKSLPAKSMLALIRAYQLVLSPWMGGSCRFWPTCSDYAAQAIGQHGAWRGGWMMLTRLARCHPYSDGGVDPVPEQFRWRCWCSQDGHSEVHETHPPWHTHMPTRTHRRTPCPDGERLRVPLV